MSETKSKGDEKKLGSSNSANNNNSSNNSNNSNNNSMNNDNNKNKDDDDDLDDIELTSDEDEDSEEDSDNGKNNRHRDNRDNRDGKDNDDGKNSGGTNDNKNNRNNKDGRSNKKKKRRKSRRRTETTVDIRDDENDDNRQKLENKVTELKVSLGLSQGSIGGFIFLILYSMIAVTEVTFTLLFNLVITLVAGSIMFVRFFTKRKVYNSVCDITNSKSLREYSNSLIHIVIICIIMLVGATMSFFINLDVIVYQLKSNPLESANGIFNSWKILNIHGQIIFILLFIIFTFSLAAFGTSIYKAYKLSQFYTRQIMYEDKHSIFNDLSHILNAFTRVWPKAITSDVCRNLIEDVTPQCRNLAANVHVSTSDWDKFIELQKSSR